MEFSRMIADLNGKYHKYLDTLRHEKWTLFLDRDGTINQRIIDGYVLEWNQFEWLGGALKAIAILCKYFNRIIIVTNQQGVGKGLMTHSELLEIHDKMITEIHVKGGRIDKIYFCPNLKEDPFNCRKPQIDMALWAQRDFPEIDFKKSVMIGDMPSDIVFGKNLGMKTISLDENNTQSDFRKDSLLEFARDLESAPHLD